LLIDLLVFLRWQRGLLSHVDGGSRLFMVSTMVWGGLVLLALLASAWARASLAGGWRVLGMLVACALIAHAVTPGSLPGLALLHAWATFRCFRPGASPVGRGALVVGTLLLSTWSSYERQYGPLSRDAMEAVLQTHVSEALAYAFQHLTIAHAGVLLAWLLTAVVRRWLVSASTVDRLPIAALVTSLILPTLFGAGTAMGSKVLDARQALQLIDRTPDAAVVPPDVAVRRTGMGDLDVVLLIGESSTRWNWSLYGYPRQTTPRMDAQRQRLIVFTDAISTHSHTVPAIRAMAYRPTVARGTLDAVQDVALPALLRQADITTSWYSAQSRFGPYSGPVSALASAADRVQFLESPSRWVHWRAPFDQHADLGVIRAIVSDMKKAPPTGQSRLIVGHHHVSHFPYCANMPVGDDIPIPGMRMGPAYFGDSPDLTDEVDCYDRSIRLTDDMLATVLEAADASQRPTVVIFAPDHGEAPDEGTAHQSDRHSARHIEIPLIMAFNQPASALLARHEAALREHATRAMTNAWLFEVIVDLFGLEIDGIEFRAAPASAQDYRPPPRVAFEGQFSLRYDERVASDRKDTIGRTRINLRHAASLDRRPSTIYAHRVNTLGKVLEARLYFDGIETDVVVHAGRSDLAVHHPPKPDKGLGFRDMLGATADRPQLKWWLDLKSPLDEDTARILRDLDATHRLRERAVIELTGGADPAVARALSSDGWSLAAPARLLIPRCFDGTTAIGCRQDAKRAPALVADWGAVALAFELRDALQVREHLAGSAARMRLMAWEQSLRSDDPEFVERLRRLPRVDDLIVRYRSRFDD